jgi:biotin synthase|tara:strand:- start:4617 stop:5639 length:1023 start_codon:yes stop_codon:yes gene_type:complete
MKQISQKEKFKKKERFQEDNLNQNNKFTQRHDWQLEEVQELFNMPFNDLIFKSAQIHRQFHDANKIQISTLLSIKTGSCPENCKYCPQSAHYNTGLEKESLMSIDKILIAARAAKESGASRFCMGAAWRNLHDRDVDNICNIIKEVKEVGLETCMTLGMLTKKQSQQLKESGLDYYNHNIDSSEEFYSNIITTRNFQDRLDTLKNVRDSGLNVCSGGIVGMGEKVRDRAKMLIILANLEKHPESVPINMLVKVKGTPLDQVQDIDQFDFIKTIAIARIMMPQSVVRLSAGREEMNEQTQALCFFAGANSIFYGEKLLTTNNPEVKQDQKLFQKLGLLSIN